MHCNSCRPAQITQSLYHQAMHRQQLHSLASNARRAPVLGTSASFGTPFFPLTVRRSKTCRVKNAILLSTFCRVKLVLVVNLFINNNNFVPLTVRRLAPFTWISVNTLKLERTCPFWLWTRYLACCIDWQKDWRNTLNLLQVTWSAQFAHLSREFLQSHYFPFVFTFVSNHILIFTLVNRDISFFFVIHT